MFLGFGYFQTDSSAPCFPGLSQTAVSTELCQTPSYGAFMDLNYSNLVKVEEKQGNPGLNISVAHYPQVCGHSRPSLPFPPVFYTSQLGKQIG